MPGETGRLQERQAGREARQGDHRHEHHRPRLPGLPPGRHLPDPAAVADRREVRRLPPDPAAGAGLAEPPPPLKQIPDGEPGAGEYLLPLGSNGTSVDPDLINDIQTLPYAQRFRLIFNELGAGLAGRGEDLEVLVKRANPVLRDVDRLFGILSAQRDQLAQLASDSEEILGPLVARARPRRRLPLQLRRRRRRRAPNTGPNWKRRCSKFPTFLREFRLTMRSLQGFSDAATPVFEDFGKAAPSLTDATRTLTPFSEATDGGAEEPRQRRRSLRPDLRRSRPGGAQGGELAKTRRRRRPANWPKLFVSLKKTGGWDGLIELIYNTTASLNGFDQYGHFGRTLVTLTNCLDYEPSPAGSIRLRRPLQRPERTTEGSASTAALSALLPPARSANSEAQTGGTVAGAGPATGDRPGRRSRGRRRRSRRRRSLARPGAPTRSSTTSSGP